MATVRNSGRIGRIYRLIKKLLTKLLLSYLRRDKDPM